MSTAPQPFSRLHVKDPDTDRVLQDAFDKLQQIQAQVATLTAEVARVKALITPPTP